MARVSRSKPSKQPAKRQAGTSSRSPAKARAAPARQARRGKSAPRGQAKQAKATQGKPSGKPARRAARPKREPRTDEVRKQVARAHPQSPATKLEEQVEHEHQDPRLSGVGGTSPEGEKVQTFNYGQFKNKAVARFDKPVNWFRRAAKPKQ